MLLSHLGWLILVLLAALAPGLVKLVLLVVDVDRQQLLLLQLNACMPVAVYGTNAISIISSLKQFGNITINSDDPINYW